MDLCGFEDSLVYLHNEFQAYIARLSQNQKKNRESNCTRLIGLFRAVGKIMRYGGQKCRLRARSRGRYLQACSILAMAVALSRALPILHTAAACLSSKDLSSGLLPRLWRWKGPCLERFSHHLCLPILAGQPPHLCFWTHDLCSLLRFFEASGTHNFPKKEH